MATRKYWLQLPQTYFSRLQQRKMRKQADGEIMQIIYLKMLLACIGNSGLILYQGVYDLLAEEIAEEIDEETEIVQKTIDYIVNNNMARKIEDEEGDGYFFPESDELTGSESESAERMRRMRKKARASQCDSDVTKSDNGVTGSYDNKNKENKSKVREEKELKNTLFNSLTLKEGETLPPSADAGGASTFTLSDCEECAKKGKVNLSESGIRAFYERMEKDGWEIKGSPVENLLLAMRGFAKNHKKYQKQANQEEPQEKKPPKKVFKSFKPWLKYHGYDSNYENGFGEFEEEIAIDAEMIQIVWDVEDLNESIAKINERLIDVGYTMEEIKASIMQLFEKWLKEKQEGR